MSRGLIAIIGPWAAVLFVSVSPGLAAVCPVPSAPHPTIQHAVDDLACTEVLLAAQTFVEEVVIGRDLVVTGASSASTVIEGRVVVDGSAVQVELHDLEVDAGAPSVAGCFPEALLSRGGAQIRAHGVVVANGDGDACVVFRDGFESGDTTAWSTTVP